MKPTVSATRTYSPRLQVDAPNRRIERGEGLIGDKHVAARKRIEQRRLADVGVADQRDQRFAMRCAAPRAALTRDVFELAPQNADAALDAAAVDLEFGFAGTARADAAAQAREIGADPDQIRLPIA